MRIFLILVLFMLVSPSFAMDWKKTSTATEPTTQADGSPLDDLQDIRFQLKRADGSPWIPEVVVPATSVNGGGEVTASLSTTISDGQKEMGTLEAVACDTSGNCGAPKIVPVVLDAQPPGEIMNLTVTTTLATP